MCMGLAIRKSRLKKCHVDYRFDYLLPSIIRVFDYYFSLFLCKKKPARSYILRVFIGLGERI